MFQAVALVYAVRKRGARLGLAWAIAAGCQEEEERDLQEQPHAIPRQEIIKVGGFPILNFDYFGVCRFISVFYQKIE